MHITYYIHCRYCVHVKTHWLNTDVTLLKPKWRCKQSKTEQNLSDV